MKKHKVIISGGGTGGHIFPALAIAKELEKKYFHRKQAERLKTWIVDLKDYIHEKEDAL